MKLKRCFKTVLSSVLAAAMLITAVPSNLTLDVQAAPVETVVETEVATEESTVVAEDLAVEETSDTATEEITTEVVVEEKEEKEETEDQEPGDTKATSVVSPEINGNSVTFRYVYSDLPDGKTLYVKGDFNNWGDTAPMTKGENDVYSCTVSDLAEGDYGYKFYYDDDSEYGYWTTDPSNDRVSNGNSVFTIGEALVSPEIDGNNVTFRYKNSNLTEDTVVYVRGSMNGWSDSANPMTRGEDGIYTLTLTLDNGDYTYKFWYDNGTENGAWLADPSNPQTSGDNSFFNIGGPIETGITSPEINGNEVTFRYNQGGEEVYLIGSMTNNWLDKVLMTKEEDSDVFSCTLTLDPGYYTYKFIVDGTYVNDLSNENKEDTNDANNFFVVPGLAGESVSGLIGAVINLPATLDLWLEGQATASQVVPEYELKTSEAANFVEFVEGNNKIKVKEGFEGSEIEFTATAEEMTAIVTVNVVEKMYNYTIYAHSFVESRMDVNNSELYVWDAAEETKEPAADFAFTETEVIDGKTWLKAVVSVPYSQKVGFVFREKEADATGAQWACPNVYYANTEAAENVTLFFEDGQTTLYKDVNDVKYTPERYLLIEYTRDDLEYENAVVYTWSGDWGTVHYKFEEPVNGKAIAKIPVLPSAIDKKINFIVKKDIPWDDENGVTNKDGGDSFFMMPADQDIVKIRFYDGKITGTLPYNKGSEMNRAEGKLNFFYRDDELFVDGNMASLDGKVQVVVKSSTGNEDIDGTYDMTYDAENERFSYDVPLVEETDYYYYFNVDGAKKLDAFNERTIVVDEVEYSLLRNVVYQLDLSASVKNAEMDYNDNNVLYLEWAAKEGASIEGFTPEKIYADLSQLGLGSKVAINEELKALTIACRDFVTPGEKTITVTVIDDCDNTYKAKTKVTVTERAKAANTSSKLGDFDWDEAVIYFAITDRFFDGNEANNTATEGYDAADETDEGRYHGGDFAGLTEKIDYLYDLGVNTIWLTPIVDNIDQDVMDEEHEDQNAEFYAYHGYWASDFTKLNPHLGNEDEFKALIDAAHAKGMKIMVDVVLNHAGYDSEETFNTILKDAEGNYINMVRGEEETIPNDEKRDGLSGLPDFITENEEVRNQLIEWQTAWMTNYDIDYYRVDTVKHVEDTTWEAFRNALAESNPEFKLIGEYYSGDYKNTAGLLNSGKMDSLLDFGFKYYAQDFVNGKISAAENELAARSKTINNTASLGGFLGSHDEDGFLYKLNNDLGKMKIAASLQMTAKGQPVIYYGEEIGQSGANNWPYYDNRYDFDWDAVTAQKKDSKSLFSHYKKMLNIRRNYSEVFAKGGRTFVTGSDAEKYEVFRRDYNGTNIYVGLNIDSAEKKTTFTVNAKPGSVYKDVYNGKKTYTVSKSGTLTVTIPAATNGGTVVLALSKGEEYENVDDNIVTIKLHYNRPDGEYVTDKGDWNVWMWADGKGGSAYELVNEGTETDPDMVATCEVEGRSINKVGFIVRKGDWVEQEGGDRFIDISDVVAGTVHVYVESGKTEFTRVLGPDAILGVKIVSATYNRETNKVVVVTSQPILGSAETEFVIKRATGEVINITEAEVDDCTYTLSIDADLTSLEELVKGYTITYDNYEYNLAMPNVYSSDEFENKYTYTGNDLGATWSEESTTFKVWAPTAQYVQLALYASGDPDADDELEVIGMTAGEQGVWSATVDGDINGTYYTYRVSVDGKVKEACDPYAVTTGVNGKRAMVINLASTDPAGWADDKGPHTGMDYTDAVIYELHVRDASIDESSGVSDAHKGKYLGLTETGTTTANGVPTALDHIKELGVTHVHLLPVYDYGSVDETRLDEPQFNWGYDPVNFNVPEGSYSTDPYNGEVRVKEFKQMVKAMHDNNLNVVMDVVYNHVYDAETYSFNQIVPKYFSRTNEDGSYNGDTGCGNTTASERTMVQKYIVDSVLYWNQEYHIDGFRFDLVGLIDAETMDKVVKAVHAVNPDILFYGEGWSMSSGTTKGIIPMATQAEAKSNLEEGILSDFAYFSDTIRNNLAGNNDLNGQGYVFGVEGLENAMKKSFIAASDWCPGPTYTVNYASCHDNYTLFDKIKGQTEGATEEEQIKMNNLSAAFYMLSEGIPFVHAGEEFLRTKVTEDDEVIHNSYNSPDYVNKLRWSNLEDEKYADVADYYKGLIAFRKNHEALRLTTPEDVAAAVTSYTDSANTLLFKVAGKDVVAGETSDGMVIIYNSNKNAVEVDLSAYDLTGTWNVCINAEDAGTEVLATVNTDENPVVTVDAISALVLVKGDATDVESVYGDNFRETLSLDKTALQLKVDNSATVTAKTNVKDANVNWTTDNEDVITVAEKEGQANSVVVTAKATGTAVLTAKLASGKTATCTIKVFDHDYVISKEELVLDITTGQTENLKVSSESVENPSVIWTSSDITIATVSKAGLVTPIGVGETFVTAVVKDGPTLTCQVTVKSSLESITINPESLDMVAGDVETLSVIVNPVKAQPVVKWYSSDSSVATVNRSTGTVTAVAAGTAVISAVAEGKKATATVTVTGKVDEATLEIPTGITAITNIHTKLKDVKLPEGWAWVYGDAAMKSFAGQSQKKFQATYTAEGCAPVTKEIPVNIISISKVDVVTPTVVELNKSADASAAIVTTGGEVPADMVSVEWISSRENVLTVSENESDETVATINGATAGTAKLSAKVTISDGTKKKVFTSKKVNVKVVKDAPASISFNSIGDVVLNGNAQKYVYDFTGEQAKIKVAVASSASKVTLTSSDKGVVKVGAVKAENGIFTAELTIKKAGYVKLTATANDAMKTNTSMEVYVKNAVPNVNTTSVELNNKSNAKASIFVYPNADYTIESVNINSEDFAVEKVNGNEYTVAMTKAVDKGNYNQKLEIKIAGIDTVYTAPLKIKVLSKDAKVTVKQTAKVNLFYTDAKGELAVTSAGNITNVVLNDCDFEYNYATGVITVKAGADLAKLDKQGTLTIDFADYTSVTKNVKIATENKAPKLTLSAKTATIYSSAGIESASVVINGDTIAAEDVNVTFKNDVKAYSKTINGATLSFERTDKTFTKSAVANIEVKKENYSKPVKLSFTIKVNTKAPKLVLSKKALTLNKNAAVAPYEADTLSFTVKDAPIADIVKLSVKAADAKSQKEMGRSIVVETDALTDSVTASLNDVKTLKKGTYKFTVYAELTNECKVSTTVSVKVVDVVAQKTVKLAAKGKIDVLNRDTTKVVYTPKYSNVSGEVATVKLTGRSSHLFDAKVVDGKIVLTVACGEETCHDENCQNKEHLDAVKLVTKYNYGVKMQITLTNGCKFVTNEMKIKLTQSKPKVTVAPKQNVMFNTVDDHSVAVTFNAATADIDRIELTNFTNVFAYEGGNLVLKDKGAVAKGKTYTLKFNVYFEGCVDSEKPVSVSYKVKVN